MAPSKSWFHSSFLHLSLSILNHLTMEYWKLTVAIFPSRQSVFPSELLKLPWQSPLLANTRKYSFSMRVCIRTRIEPALQDKFFLVLASRGLCHGSFKSSLGNMLCLEGNIATVIFQYSIVRWMRMNCIICKTDNICLVYCNETAEQINLLPIVLVAWFWSELWSSSDSIWLYRPKVITWWYLFKKWSLVYYSILMYIVV